MKYTPVIGLEIHVELKTKNKMFCQCSADYFGKEPNSNTCPVCLGMPGALPVPNRKAVEWTIKIGQALNCAINKHSKFDRKHYFYPDLPKAYQISQYDQPIAVKGHLDIITTPSRGASHPSLIKEGNQKEISSFTKEEYPKGEVVKKRIRITRVHLEEDTGKLTHSADGTLVDFNRSSVPLVEIVTEADFDNSEDVKIFLEELHTIIRYLDVSDADMEKGSMRMEPNISLRLTSSSRAKRSDPNEIASSPTASRNDFELPNYKVEVKNINSFNFAKKAIDYEFKRQAEILDEGKIPPQETRGYNDNKGITFSQRSKEDAHDYRYFPEPDIPTMVFTDDLLATIKKSIKELPSQKVERYVKDFEIKRIDAFILTRDSDTSEYYEKCIHGARGLKDKIQHLYQKIANAIINKKLPINTPEEATIALLTELYKEKETDLGLLDESIQKIIDANPKAVADYKGGNKNTIMFMVGQVMREMKGQADAMTVRGELQKKLD